MNPILKKLLKLVACLAVIGVNGAILTTPAAAILDPGCMGKGGAGCYDDTCYGSQGPYQCCLIHVNSHCGTQS